MIYWIIIIIGIFVLSISLSNPFYNLTIKKYLKLKIIYEILIRMFIFFVSVILIFIGLYLESLI